MNKTRNAAVCLLIASALAAAPLSASAHEGRHGVGRGLGLLGAVVVGTVVAVATVAAAPLNAIAGGPPPVRYVPAPVYYAPAPVYVVPAQPYAPPMAYQAPAYVPYAPPAYVPQAPGTYTR